MNTQALLSARIIHNDVVLLQQQHKNFDRLQVWLLTQLEHYNIGCLGEIIQQDFQVILQRYRVSLICD